MFGRSVSYFYMHEDGQGYLKISAGRVKAGKWEFLTDVAEFPHNISRDTAESLATQYFSQFMSTKAQLFWKGEIESNSDDYGHPMLNG